MRRVYLALSLFLMGVLVYAQVPHAFNYQSVAYDNEGNVLADREVAVKFEILQGSVTGTVVYAETHWATTSKNGVLNLLIGQGEPVDALSFEAIDWSLAPYFVHVSMDADGGNDYKGMAVTQMLSVPYALYAEKAGSVNEKEAHKFRVTAINGPSATLLTGSNAILDGIRAIHLCVDYLDEPNQEVKYEVSLPEGLTAEYPYAFGDAEKEEREESGPLGRYIVLEFSCDDLSPGVYSCSIKIWNKYGYTKEYPFLYKVDPPYQPEEPEAVTPTSNLIEP